MREVCFVLTGERILRVYIGSASRVPDSRERWEIIWEYRDEITEIVHTHPGGFLDFSKEDLTTMEAVEAGTGCEFAWSIVTEGGYLRRRGCEGDDKCPNEDPWWLEVLRELSFHSTHQPKSGGHSPETAETNQHQQRKKGGDNPS